mmetsp:Transcript_22657/g.52884  ORF Transcript_22657/g.52884 Transcript_22657/m.52884 type:complete len:502 (+) Transcript_22657:167-1672(+)
MTSTRHDHLLAIVCWLLASWLLTGASASRPAYDESQKGLFNVSLGAVEVAATAARHSASALSELNMTSAKARTRWHNDIIFITTGQWENEKKSADGALTGDGEASVLARVGSMTGSALTRLRNADQVWVAPTLGAMQTAIAAVVAGMKEDPDVAVPEFQVLKELQPRGPFKRYAKVNFKEVLLTYAQRVCREQLGHRYRDLLTATVEGLHSAYQSVISGKSPPAETALEVFHDIHELKYKLADAEKVVLMVGDRTLATYMFMIGIPNTLRSEEKPFQNVVGMVRVNVASLSHCAAVLASWCVVEYEQNLKLKAHRDDNRFTVPYFDAIEVESEALGSRAMATLDTRRPLNVPFDQKRYIRQELEIRGEGKKLLPDHLDWQHYRIFKKTKNKRAPGYSGWKDRIVTVASYPNPAGGPHSFQGFISWATLFFEGESGLRGGYSLFDVAMEYEDQEASEFYGKLKLEGGGTHWYFKDPADTEGVLIHLRDEFKRRQNQCYGVIA